MATSDSVMDMIGDGAQLKTIPAFLSIAYAVASLFAFGGLASLELTWISYTLTQSHAVILSLGVYALAFASSETNRFDSYSSGQQVLIVAGPAIMLAQRFLPSVGDYITTNSPAAGIVAFVVAFLGWAVMVR